MADPDPIDPIVPEVHTESLLKPVKEKRPRSKAQIEALDRARVKLAESKGAKKKAIADALAELAKPKAKKVTKPVVEDEEEEEPRPKPKQKPKPKPEPDYESEEEEPRPKPIKVPKISDPEVATKPRVFFMY